MERFNKLIQDKEYQSYLDKNALCEKEREFCKHDTEHFLDVARLCYIIALENNASFSKEIIYTCAFLHDIGRWQQYTLNVPHEEASYQLAQPLLQKYNFDEREQQEILQGILRHRKGCKEGLGELMYKSDKLSRRCYSCKAYQACNWPLDKRNRIISY